MTASAEELLAILESRADDSFRLSLARFGLDPASALGVPMPALRKLAVPLRGNTALAADLWRKGRGLLEPRLLACVIAGPALDERSELEEWAAGLDSWWLTDTFCNEIVRRLPAAPAIIRDWSARREEYVARAAYSAVALLAQHDRTLPESSFLEFLSLAEKGAGHPALYARKSADWAMRQIGKRSPALRAAALAAAERLAVSPDPLARAVARRVASELRRRLSST